MTITKVFLAHQGVQKQRALSKVDEGDRSLKTVSTWIPFHLCKPGSDCHSGSPVLKELIL